MIMHSDGMQTDWDLNAYPGLTVRDSGLIAAVLYRDLAAAAATMSRCWSRNRHDE